MRNGDLLISYKYDKEREIAIFLAEKMSNFEALSILNAGKVNDANQAEHLAKFFWCAVDEMIKLSKSNVEVCGETNLEEWSEYLMASLRSYLRGNGYIKAWYDASENS
jgi:hypothetical protein